MPARPSMKSLMDRTCCSYLHINVESRIDFKFARTGLPLIAGSQPALAVAGRLKRSRDVRSLVESPSKTVV